MNKQATRKRNHALSRYPVTSVKSHLIKVNRVIYKYFRYKNESFNIFSATSI